MKHAIFGLCGGLLAACSGGQGGGDGTTGAFDCPVAGAAGVAFVQPADGAEVAGEFQVRMSAGDLAVEPAGTMTAGTGHMHILVDVPFVEAGQVVPNDAQHLHYGDGSLEATLTLEAGEHVLRLLAADGAHRAYGGEGCRDEIGVTVN